MQCSLRSDTAVAARDCARWREDIGLDRRERRLERCVLRNAAAVAVAACGKHRCSQKKREKPEHRSHIGTDRPPLTRKTPASSRLEKRSPPGFERAAKRSPFPLRHPDLPSDLAARMRGAVNVEIEFVRKECGVLRRRHPRPSRYNRGRAIGGQGQTDDDRPGPGGVSDGSLVDVRKAR